MKTVVYADVYFILNFSIDLICLALCGAIGGKSRRKMRLCIASALGGIYACAALFITYTSLSAISALAVCLAMYFIAYAPRSIGGVVYGGVLLFCVNALIGGLYSAMVSVASGGSVNTEKFRYYPFFLTLVAVLVFMRLLVFRSAHKTVTVRIQYKDRSASFNSLVDTANSLREPISGIGVALVACGAAQRLFTEKEAQILMGDADDTDAYTHGFRYILMSTAAGNKKCSCVKADSALVDLGTKKTEVSLYLTVTPGLSLGDTECLLPNSLNLDL